MNSTGSRIRLKTTLFDIVFTLLLAALTVYLSVRFATRGKGVYAQVTTPHGNYVYSLEQGGRHEIQGLYGGTTINIENGAISIVESFCPNKTCVSKGAISEVGEFNACLPNGVSVYITDSPSADKAREYVSGSGEKADAVSI